MSVLSNADLATAISSASCGNLETINDDTNTQLSTGEAIFVVPIGAGGNGIATEEIDNVVDTLVLITETNAKIVNTLITTDYEIVSQNGFPN